MAKKSKNNNNNKNKKKKHQKHSENKQRQLIGWNDAHSVCVYDQIQKKLAYEYVCSHNNSRQFYILTLKSKWQSKLNSNHWNRLFLL